MSSIDPTRLIVTFSPVISDIANQLLDILNKREPANNLICSFSLTTGTLLWIKISAVVIKFRLIFQMV